MGELHAQHTVLRSRLFDVCFTLLLRINSVGTQLEGSNKWSCRHAGFFVRVPWRLFDASPF